MGLGPSMDRAARRVARLAASVLAAALVMTGAWLFLAALPALADGGPHVSATNNGSSVLTADSCAGCHRAHTAQGQFLINAASEEALCLTCHGAQSAGATTDVLTGVQYTSGAQHNVPGGAGTQLGALRGGGFDQARIESTYPARQLKNGNTLGDSDNHFGKVTVGIAKDVTSAHLNLPANALSAPGVAWGNGGDNTGAGPTVVLSCASCHNPHGNGQYRILNPVPEPVATSGTFTPVLVPASVTDSPLGTPDINGVYPTKNYTVLQVRGTMGTPSTYLLYASDVLDARSATPTKPWPAGDYAATGGDYWHVRVPWNSTTAANDAPNGRPIAGGGIGAFQVQMTSWCSACHSRYYSVDGHDPSPDALFAYRHETVANRACTTCHVAHGSNARMEGANSSTMPFPDGSAPLYAIGGSTGDSRLLKVDNRGTCQLCHDPTYTLPVNTYTGPTPTPGVP
ncbi:MAG: hypothetical protein A2Z32_01640 [Chloroflexi bacterium RBG_16_69_14]|nr:MAG: hypothetical protein A2Z32_01640 [Chloroflexi bacterium RBG_16_69_14]